MFKKILLGIALVVVVLLGVIAMQPPTYTVTRSQTIAAPAADVFVLVNNLRQWEKWFALGKAGFEHEEDFRGE